MSAMLPHFYDDVFGDLTQAELNAIRRRNWEFECFCGDLYAPTIAAYSEYNDAMVKVTKAGDQYAANPMSAVALSELKLANERLSAASDLLDTARANASAHGDAVRAIGESINWEPWLQ